MWRLFFAVLALCALTGVLAIDEVPLAVERTEEAPQLDLLAVMQTIDPRDDDGSATTQCIDLERSATDQWRIDLIALCASAAEQKTRCMPIAHASRHDVRSDGIVELLGKPVPTDAARICMRNLDAALDKLDARMPVHPWAQSTRVQTLSASFAREVLNRLGDAAQLEVEIEYSLRIYARGKTRAVDSVVLEDARRSVPSPLVVAASSAAAEEAAPPVRVRAETQNHDDDDDDGEVTTKAFPTWLFITFLVVIVIIPIGIVLFLIFYPHSTTPVHMGPFI